MNNKKTFVKITNEDIYKEMQNAHRINEEQHQMIIERLDRTNGKVKLGHWMATTAIMLSLVFAGWFVQHLLK